MEPFVDGTSCSVRLQREPLLKQQVDLQEKPLDVDDNVHSRIVLPLDISNMCISARYQSHSYLGGFSGANTHTMTIVGTNKKQIKCLYCAVKGDNVYFYLTIMQCDHELLDKLYLAGWWRRGTICYKPDIRSVCCPDYAIRLEVSKYVISKSQRAVAQKFKNFLQYGDVRWKPDASHSVELYTPSMPVCHKLDIPGERNCQTMAKKEKQKHLIAPCKGADASKPPCRKAKEIRRENRKEKHGEFIVHCKPPKTVEEILADFNCVTSDEKHSFRQELHPCNPMSKKLQSLLACEYELWCKFQDMVLTGKPMFQSFEEYVWACTKTLVTNSDSSSSNTLGTYHIHYFLDDVLTMVTLVDITPQCFASKIAFYDPEIRFIHPGIFTIISEIALTRELQKSMPSLKYYMLGPYNHTVPKVSYKRQFHPTEIQCPITYQWLPIEEAIPRICQNKYARLSDNEYDPYLDKAVNKLMLSCSSIPAAAMPDKTVLRSGDCQINKELLAKFVQEFGPYGISDDIIINLTAEVDMS